MASGKEAYYSVGQCFVCHGDGAISGGMVPDLRYATPETHRIWNEIVLDGAYAPLGMPGFGEKLTEQQATAIQMYVLSRAAAERQLRQQIPQDQDSRMGKDDRHGLPVGSR